MSESDPKDSSPEFSDSDLQWYAALTGESARDPDSMAAHEGRALRIALEQRRQEMAADAQGAAVTSDAALLQQLQQLQQRALREGVFDRPPAAAPVVPPAAGGAKVIEFPWWRRRTALVAMAASVLLAVLVLPQLTSRPDYPEPPAMLGGDGLQSVRSAEPRQAAERLAAALRQAGLRPGLYQRGASYLVDINLVGSELPAAEPAFAPLQLKPAAGFNRVEFSS